MEVPMTTPMLIVNLCFAAVFSIISYTVAKRKGRSEFLWGTLGFFFGIMGLAILALLPKKEKATTPVEETTGPSVQTAHNESAASINDDAFELPKAPRISGSKSISWYYIDPMEDNAINGPLSLNDLRKSIHNKKLDGTTYIWCDEFEDWQVINEFSNASLLLDPDFIE